MKKLLYTIIFIILSLIFSNTTFAVVCDQIFEGTVLRYDRGYKFYDVWNNNTSKDTFINQRKIRFIDFGDSTELMTSTYLDPGSSFDWTQELKDNNFRVPAGTSMRFIETGETNWRVSKHPETRTDATRDSYDFMIYYDVDYDKSNNYPDASDDISHIECEYYSVSWCGDGLRDKGYEVCDPNDSSQAGWGNGGCSATCESININPPATCDSISISPNTGVAPFTTTITCAGTDATSYRISCGNGSTIDSQTGQCVYATGGDYEVFCTVNDTITSNSCRANVIVTAPTPAIQVEKYSGNPNDLDGNTDHNQLDDTQTVSTGATAIFTIEINNFGNEDLENITLTDILAPNCDKTDSETKAILLNIGNNDEVFNIGESFTYTCSRENTQSNYENRINVRGVGIVSGEDNAVTDTDATQVRVSAPEVRIVKIDENSNDLDGINGNDTQTVNFGSGAVFGITVTNIGTETLKNVVISDVIAPNCNKTDSQTKSILLTIGNNDEFFDVGEEFSYTCDRGDSQNNYTNTIQITSIGVGSSFPANDSDDSNVVLDNVPGTFDLAITKEVTSTGTYTIGDIVDYNIVVENQGSVDATNVEVIDYIPNNMELVSGNGWSTASGSETTQTISSVTSGSKQILTLSLRIMSGASGTLTNYAEINDSTNSELLTDCDSTEESDENDNFSDPQSSDFTDLNDNPNGCFPSDGDEDDIDLASITVESIACQATITGPQSSSINVLTPGLCANSGQSPVNFSSTISGNTTDYTWACSDGNNVYSGGNCFASFTTSGGGGGGGGGSSYRCNDMIISGNNIKCIGNYRARTFGIICDTSVNGSSSSKIEQFKTFTKDSDNNNFANFNCETINNPICYVYHKAYEDSYIGQAWRTSPACKNLSQYCGNGKLEAGEQCEAAFDDEGNIGEFPDFCSDTCKLKDDGFDDVPIDRDSNVITIPGSDGNLITIPDEGEIGFVGMHDLVIGHNENLSDFNDEIYIWNRSNYSFSNSIFNGICLTTSDVDGKINNGDSLSNVGLTQHCTDINSKFYPGQKIYLKKPLNDIVANKDKVDGPNYEDNNLVVTIRTTKNMSPYSQILNWSDNLTGKFRVRVAKPSIQTTGATSFTKVGVIADANKISEEGGINIEGGNNNDDKNNNNVGVGTTSSFSNTIDDYNEEVREDADQYNKESSVIDNDLGSDVNVYMLEDVNETYNGLDNVFIIKDANVILSETDLDLSDSTTYIIDGGDLIINGNISSNKNIAFVLKNGGNINIGKYVTEIKGTYIVLDDGLINGDESAEQLIVRGSFYGDTVNLVNNRYKVTKNNGELSFGTVVSFGSSIFQKPAPMVTSFINTYLSTSKVAK